MILYYLKYLVNINIKNVLYILQSRMYSKLLEQVDYNRVRSIAKTSLTEDPLIPMIEKIVKAADKRKAVITLLSKNTAIIKSVF